MTWAAVFAILPAFAGKLGALLQTIPVPAMGGIVGVVLNLVLPNKKK